MSQSDTSVEKLLKRSQVYHNLAKLKRGGTLDRKPGSGRKPKYGKPGRRVISKFALKNDRDSNQRLAIRLQERNSTTISRLTIWRYLAKAKILRLLHRKVPQMTIVHKKKRLAWCFKNRHRDWSIVLFSDESCMQFYGNTLK